MNIRSLRIQAVTVSVVMALVTGCGTASDPASSAAQPDPELTDITVAALPAADLAGLYIALDQGLFTKQGLRVTIEPIPSSQAIIPDQLKGQVDISAGSYIPYIAAQAAAGRAATVMSVSSGSGCPADDAVLPVVPHPVTRAMITDTVTGTERKLRMFIVASRERLNCGRTRNTS